MDQDCTHIAKERVVVLEPLHCAGWRGGCSAVECKNQLCTQEEEFRLHMLTIKIDDCQRPVVPMAVDWHKDKLLGKDGYLLK